MNMQSPIKGLAATVDRSALVAALGAAARVVEKRNSIPILECVLIQASASGLSFTATDLDITTVRPCDAVPAVFGRVAVPAHAFLKLAKGLPDGAVSLSVGKDGYLLVTAGRKSFSLQTRAPEDFPAEPIGTVSCGFEIGAQTLRDMLARTELAISNETSRYYLNGVFLNVGAKELRATATNGHCLAQVTTALPEGAEGFGDDHHGNRGLIIPTKTVRELLSALKDMGGSVLVQQAGTRLHFVADDWGITTKTIQGTFPDYNRVIPAAGDPVTVVVEEMLEALDGVSAVLAVRHRPVKLDISAYAVKLTCNNPDVGSASESVDAHRVGPALQIGFNAEYLRDILKEIEGVHATIETHDFSSPVRITDPADPSALYVLMPLRV